MSAHAIEAVRLSKRYSMPRAHKVEPAKDGVDVRAVGGDIVTRDRDRTRRWIDAVDDLTFVIGEGEGVGLIGPNGAGKSTLLKLLSRVTRPSSGYADIYGRVGALLEVGMGFHPELTGRENVFLSGAVLGLSRRDTQSRFDEIVEFAEIAKFLDMPVKRYSTGMYARLGFAVAAHLRPDILIVDEVLAVGDLAFQAKCLAHMKHLTRDGTTVLFVSHSMLSIADFCSRALVMAGGRITFDGAAADAIADYRRVVADQGDPRTASAAVGSRQSLIINGRPVDRAFECSPHERLRVEIALDEVSTARQQDVTLNLVIESPDGRKAIHLRSDLTQSRLRLGPGPNTFGVDIDDISLVPGTYWLWGRIVGLDVAAPAIIDSERILLTVSGDQRLESIAQPHHCFWQR